jgi:hypothetical protein
MGAYALFYDYTGLQRDVRPAGTVSSVSVDPVRPSSPLRRHAGHYDDIRDAAEAYGDKTSPRPPLYHVWLPVDATLEPARGRRPDSQPLRHYP